VLLIDEVLHGERNSLHYTIDGILAPLIGAFVIEVCSFCVGGSKDSIVGAISWVYALYIPSPSLISSLFMHLAH